MQDVGLSGVDDASLLAWAAAQDRVLITHDVSTMTAYAYRRVAGGEHMPGVFEVSRSVPVAAVIEDIRLLSECSNEGEWEGHVRYLPLRRSAICRRRGPRGPNPRRKRQPPRRTL